MGQMSYQDSKMIVPLLLATLLYSAHLGSASGACGSNCESCVNAGPGLCDTCSTGYRTSLEKLCDICSSNCVKCSSAGKGKCDSNSCVIGYTRDDNSECKACTSNCLECSSNGPGKCDPNQCSVAFAYAYGTQTCVACPDKCSECTVAEDGTSTECAETKCFSGYGRKCLGFWDSTLDNLIAQTTASGIAQCDKACIIGLDGGAAWTTSAHTAALPITREEGATIAKCFNSKDFTSFMANGVRVNGVKYQFRAQEEDGKTVHCKKIGMGALILQASKTAIVIAHVIEGGQQGYVNDEVRKVIEHLESTGF